jgi:hypothetical protein
VLEGEAERERIRDAEVDGDMSLNMGKTVEDLLQEEGIQARKPGDEFYENVEDCDPVLRDHRRLPDLPGA